MEKDDRLRRRDLGAAGALMSLAMMLAACGPRIGGPAPMVSGDQPPPPVQVIVQRGQTLSGIAHAYRVPMSVVADANHLSPPYRILIGQALIIPGGGGPSPYGPAVATAEQVPPPPSYALPPVPAAPPPPVSAPPVSAPPVSALAIPLDRPPLAAAARPPAAAGPVVLMPPPAASPPANPPISPAHPGAVSPPTAEAFSPSAAPPPAASAVRATPASPGPAAAAEPPQHNAGTFLWPVRGRVLEGYGVGPGGTHNDGINIAAPHGAAVQAADGGVVAYSGNELRGYGNLILIKHANGWISAYAHCDLILVKTGQKVARGQVIARVGATGNVSEPQLHFELRRGKKPVDPNEYLAPLSTATTKDAHSS